MVAVHRTIGIDPVDRQGQIGGVMRRSIKLMIDGSLLEKELRTRDITKWDASLKIGYSHSYLSGCCVNGEISERAMKLLDALLGIKYEDIKPKPQVVKPDRNLIQLSRVLEQKEKVEFFENCEEKISNAVVTLNVCLDLIDQLQSIREQVEADMKELMTVQEVYQKTLKRVKEAS